MNPNDFINAVAAAIADQAALKKLLKEANLRTIRDAARKMNVTQLKPLADAMNSMHMIAALHGIEDAIRLDGIGNANAIAKLTLFLTLPQRDKLFSVTTKTYTATANGRMSKTLKKCLKHFAPQIDQKFYNDIEWGKDIGKYR